MKKSNIHNIEEIHIIKENEQLFLCITGWVVYYKKNTKIQIKVDNKIYDYGFNVKRGDVDDIYGNKLKLNFGFQYKILVDKFKKIELVLLEEDKNILIKKWSFNAIDFIDIDINYNFENISIDHLQVKIKGWLLNKASNKPIDLVIKNQKNKIFYNNSTNIERIDVVNFFNSNIASQCGFNTKIDIDSNTDELQIFANDNGFLVNLKNIDIPDNWKNSQYRTLKKLLKCRLKIIKQQIKSTLENKKVLSPKQYLKNYKTELEKVYIELFDNDLNLQAYNPYDKWIENNIITQSDYLYMQQQIKKFKYTPTISILMPVWNVDKKWLEKAIYSIKEQSYSNWELCIADDKSTKAYIKPYLESLMKNDSRIKVVFRSENGNISEATNSAFEISTGEYILLMDNDDELECNALFEIVKCLQDDNKPDILYSDDDKINESGKRYAPQFKPDWSPELLLSFMYFSHIFSFKREMYSKVGGCRIGFEGCQDYDLALRMTELTDNIKHIDKILYHWRSIEGSTAQDGNAKPEAFERGIKAVQEALDRRKINGKVIRPDFAIKSNLGIFSIEFPNDGPEVSIIIPTKNQKTLLKRCIDSIIKKTSYNNYRIVVINNDSDEKETIEYLNELRSKHMILDIHNKDDKFSYSYINNQAVSMVNSEYVLFLNNDTEVIDGNWLSAMVGYAQIDNVGIVGARLLFPDNRVQHAGVVLGLYNGMVAPAFKLLPDYDLGYFNFAKVTRNYSCVTAACMIIRKSLFNELNGFDEENFAVAYNDVDLCVRCLKQGKRIVYAAQAELYHYEGATRGFVDNIDEVLNYKKMYGNYTDKYYNKNLSVYDEQFKINSDCTLDYGNSLQEKTILFSTHNLNFEGAPLHLYELIRGFKNNVTNLNAIVISPIDGNLREKYEKIGVKVVIIQYSIHISSYKDAYEECIADICEKIKNYNADLIYANTLETFLFIDIADRLKIPSVWNIHESVDYKNYFNDCDEYVNKRYLECFVNAKKVIFVCDSTLKLYSEMNRVNNFDYIYNGIDEESIDFYKDTVSKEEAKRQLKVPNDMKVISIIGTVCERKGQLDFVKAAINIINNSDSNVIFFIVGCRENDYLEQIKEAISQNNAEKRIILVKETSEVNIYYRASDIFVCASYNESFPRVTLEAMVFDLPIVSTGVFGLKEQILENINGLLFEPGDIGALKKHISLLLNNKFKRLEMANNSKKVLKLLNSHDSMIKKYLLLVEKYL